MWSVSGHSSSDPRRRRTGRLRPLVSASSFAGRLVRKAFRGQALVNQSPRRTLTSLKRTERCTPGNTGSGANLKQDGES
jgi:hypothetical protein